MNNQNFCCSIPWTGFSNEPDGKAQPCCLYKGYILDKNNQPMYVQNYSVNEILKSDYMKDLRDRFRRGEKPDGCSICWIDESNGYESKRIIYNSKIRHDPEIIWEKEPDFLSEFQLIINNSCNLKCRSCTPSHSSQWQIELKNLTGSTGYAMPFKQSGDLSGKLWTEREQWYKHLTRLEVVGGEPFYVKQWHDIFYELIERGYSKNIDLTLTTNATLFYEKLLVDISENFRSISIGLSIDGIGPTYEYLRYPGDWKVTYANMIKYRNLSEVLPINLQINFTISWLNAYEATDLHEMVYNEFSNFSIWNNLVHSPTHMALWSAPIELKKAIEDKWTNYSWRPQYRETMNSILQFMNSKNISNFEIRNNLDIFFKTDNYRKENLFDSIPYLKKFIQL
jgi:sulfatase maturation enzyme AslB (radical SAM superfamily)